MLDLGIYISIAGIITFKNAEPLREVIRKVPVEHLLVETDAPFLAPVPMRGRRNEPAFLPHVLAALAQVRGWSLAEAEARTEAAFFDLFHKIPHPKSAAA